MHITDPQHPDLRLYTVVGEYGGTENIMAASDSQAISASYVRTPLTAIRHRAVIHTSPKLEVAEHVEADFTVPVWPYPPESKVFSDLERMLAAWMVENRLTESDTGSVNEMTHKFLTELTNDGERLIYEQLADDKGVVAEVLEDHRTTLRKAAPSVWLLVDWGSETIETYPGRKVAIRSLGAPLPLHVKVRLGGAREVTPTRLKEIAQ